MANIFTTLVEGRRGAAWSAQIRLAFRESIPSRFGIVVFFLQNVLNLSTVWFWNLENPRQSQVIVNYRPGILIVTNGKQYNFI